MEWGGGGGTSHQGKACASLRGGRPQTRLLLCPGLSSFSTGVIHFPSDGQAGGSHPAKITLSPAGKERSVPHQLEAHCC